MKIVTAAQMQALDRRAIQEARIPSLTLMARAGTGVIEDMEEVLGPTAGKTVVVVCGKGNNGGDGFVVARLLRQKRARVWAVLVAKPTELSADAQQMYRRFVKVAGKSAVLTCPVQERLRRLLRDSDLIVDALLGTGLSAPVTGAYKTAIEAINETGRPVTAVDLPSGLHADTGGILGAAVRATLTVTFGLPKIGLYVGAGIDLAGIVRIKNIGIPESYAQAVSSPISLITAAEVRQVLPSRPPSAHKGTFGHAGIVAGSIGKSGAAAMVALAALRVGAGLVTVAAPSSLNDVLEAKLLEVMTVPMPETRARTLARSSLDRLAAFAESKTAIAVGPGLTTHPETVELVHALLARLVRPCVLDADALNALAGRTARLANCKVPLVLTPHPGEMARLEEGASSQTINADRIGVATRFAQRCGVVLVLKGARTVIAHPDGRAALCPTGNPGMATAGTGDALTGMIVGLLAQGLSPWDAARAGVYCHGLAGDLAAVELGQAGMTAGDLIRRIPRTLMQTGSPLAAL